MKKVKNKKLKKDKLKIVNLKVTGKDRDILLKNAKKFSAGNLSAWLRYAGLKYVPKKSEQILNIKERYEVKQSI